MIYHTERLRSISEELHNLSSSLQEAMEPIVDSLRNQSNAASNAATKLEKALKTSFRNIKATSVPSSELGDIPDFMRENWPLAVPLSQTPHNIDEKGLIVREKFRALQAAGLILDSAGLSTTTNKNILDFSCGNGYITKEMAARSSGGSTIVGYGSAFSTVTGEDENAKLPIYTNSKDKVENIGPYNLIYAYHVLDQLVDEDPIDVLKWLGSLLTSDGRIFIRTHPWTSRHGGNIHEQSNKAYLHLALTTDELLSHGISAPHNLKIVRPLAAYEKWISESGLKIVSRDMVTKKVESFFHGPILDRIIKINWAGSLNKDQALKIMSNEFIDFVLTQ